MATFSYSAEIAKLLGIEKLSERAFSLLWMALAQDNYFFAAHDLTQIPRIQLLETLSKFDQNIINTLKRYFYFQTVPESQFNWINQSLRQEKWFEDNVMRYYTIVNGKHLIQPKHLSGRLRCMANFDYITVKIHPEEKLKIVNSMRTTWNIHTAPDRKLAWINEENASERRQFFSDWLASPSRLGERGKEHFQTHDELLMFIDQLKYSVAERTILADKSRIAWNQRQRRKEKVQFNFLLSKSTIKELKMLAEKYRLSQTEIVEILIYSEASDNYHIDKRLNYLNQARNPTQ